MRRTILTLALVVLCGPLATPSVAQQPAKPTPLRAAVKATNREMGPRGPLPGEPDLLKPYASSAREPERPAPKRRSTYVPPPPLARSRASVFDTAHTYFPAMRAGRSPNSNTVDTRTLCVPGRMALIRR